MRERASMVVGLLVLLLVTMPLGYVVHISPRFPGSLTGTLIGIAGALLMLAALAYPLVKRVRWLNERITPHVTLPTLLAVHIYAGVMGPIVGMIHSAHKFTSPLGIALVASMLVVVLSGYVGRFYLARVAKAVRGRGGDLAALQRTFASGTLTDEPGSKSPFAELVRILFDPGAPSAAPTRQDAALALADVEYAVRAERALQSILQRWLTLHILVGVLLYVLLALHVWSGLYFGLRWL